MLDHMLSIHVRSRVFATLDDAAQFIKSVSMLYDAYVETKNVGMLKVQPASATSMCLHLIDRTQASSGSGCTGTSMPCTMYFRAKQTKLRNVMGMLAYWAAVKTLQLKCNQQL